MSALGTAIAIVVLVILILVEFPVAFAFATASIIMAVASGRDLATILPTAFWETGGFALLALPLFIIAGMVMRAGEISDRMVAVVERVIGRVGGGLGAVTVLSSMLFGAISGSGAAAIAAIGSVMMPKMRQAGYEPGYVTALVACSSVLSLLIPPSIPMIVFALTAGLPVSLCFLSTIGPALVIACIYVGYNYRFARKSGVDQGVIVADADRVPFHRVFLSGLPALFMPVLMLGGIYSGAFTPTEAAALALAYGIFIGLVVYRTLNGASIFRAFVEGGIICAGVIAILFFLIIFAKLLSLQGIPGSISRSLVSLSDNYYVVLLFINIALLIIGMFLDDISGSILAAVVLLPVANEIGVHPIHFAAIVGTNLGLGNITPPFAPLLFVAGSMGGLELRQFIRPALRLMVLGHLPVILLVTYVPALSLAIPNMVAS